MKRKKVFAIFMALLLATSLFSASALAACSNDANAKNIAQCVRVISEEDVEITSINDQKVELVKTIAEDQTGAKCYSITGTDLLSLTVEEKLDVSDTLLAEVGYSAEEIAGMDISDKLAMVSTDSLETKVTYYKLSSNGDVEIVDAATALAAAEGDTTSTSNGWMKSVLSYSRVRSDRYFITNLCHFLSTPSDFLTDRVSICVQGFAADVNTAKCQYAYNGIINGVDHGRFVENYTNSSSQFEAIAGGSGAGIAFEIQLIPYVGSGIIQSAISVYCSGYFNYSTVEVGGSFNIWGAYAHKFKTGDVSVGYPWGVSVSGETKYNMCKTSLMATRY